MPNGTGIFASMQWMFDIRAYIFCRYVFKDESKESDSG